MNRQPVKSIIEFRGGNVAAAGTIRLEFTPFECMYKCDIDSVDLKVGNGVARWIGNVNEPYWVYTGRLFGKQNTYWLGEPGDSVVMNFDGRVLSFSGKGAEKFELLNKINDIKSSLKKELSNPVDYYTKSLEDYLEWHHCLKKRYELLTGMVDSYKHKLSALAFSEIKVLVLDGILDSRTDKFYSFLGFAKRSGIDMRDVCNIYDSTYGKYTTSQYLPSMSRSFLGSWGPIRLEIERKYNFDFNSGPLGSKRRNLLYYELALKSYNGLVREKFLLEFLTDKMINELGFVPEVEEALAKYYAEPGYPLYKKFVKDFELRARVLRNGNPAPGFSLKDSKGDDFTNHDLKGKIALIDFWFTGCIGCAQFTPSLKQIEDTFRNDTNVAFVSVSIDSDSAVWMKSLREGKYTTPSGIKLYTGGRGDDHEMIKAYNIGGYPAMYLIDGRGNITDNPLPTDKGVIIDAIKKQLVEQKDGPYLLYQGDTAIMYSMNEGHATVLKNGGSEISVQTDEYNKTFAVTLKKELGIEPCEFSQPQRLLVLSDIEGNFGALRKLLTRNRVIDENFNWVFGNGHVVIVGDVFDRGRQVTECLWLIYSLEEKAKKQGGYVHFILGNHEIMNLNGDTRYGHRKYKTFSGALKGSYTGLYGIDSELGRWLRTKNIMEKIGDVLFVHGGISKEVTAVPWSVKQLNDLAKPYFDKANIAQQSADNTLSLLFNSADKLSPFWYRSYYIEGNKIKLGGTKGIDTLFKTPDAEVDAALHKFKVSRIITGHTIVADTISVHYGGKVINTDTHHAKGKSEALLIEGDHFYRVNDKGERKLLFVDVSRKDAEYMQ